MVGGMKTKDEIDALISNRIQEKDPSLKNLADVMVKPFLEPKGKAPEKTTENHPGKEE